MSFSQSHENGFPKTAGHTKRTAGTAKGEPVMKAYDSSEFEAYKAETQQRWGQIEAYKEYTGKTKSYSKDKWNELAGELDAIFAEFAACMKNGKKSDSAEAQTLVKKLQGHITESYYLCTNEILAGLGKMYAGDERFKNNIDKHAAGTAEFVSRAIEHHCSK